MPAIHFNKALQTFNEGKLKKALIILKKINNPSIEELKLKFQIYITLKQDSLAILTADDILKGNLESVDRAQIYFFKGICLSNLNKKAEAIKAIELSVEADDSINNASAKYNLLCLYFQENQFVKLEQMAKTMHSWSQYYVKILILLLKTAGIVANKEKISELSLKLCGYESEFDNNFFAELVRYLIALKYFDKAHQSIENFEKIKSVEATILRAELLFAKGEYDQLLTYFEDKKQRVPLSAAEHYLIAKACDKKGLFEEAFSNLVCGANLSSAQNREKKVVDNISSWNKLADKIAVQKINTSPKHCSEISNNLVFIFGFPRSGTTLLDNILDTQSNTLVLSEKGVLPQVISAFKVLKLKYPQDIINLTNIQKEQLIDIYFQSISAMGFSYNNNTIIVDKGPHHTECLPLINALFPKAKLIATVRHPLDVCLSCFQQNFEFNDHNAHLITMNGIVNRYKQVFTLLGRYQKELKFSVKEIKYEELVTNFDEVMLDIFDYLGVIPKERFDNFHEHAAKKYVTSASRGQTDKALYKDSMYKWHKYEKHLLPYKKELSYFIDKYGYQDS